MLFYKCFTDTTVPNAEKLQKDLNAHPELSFKENYATSLIKAKLEALNIKIVDIGTQTGVIALLECAQKNAPCVALRADIDAIETKDGARHLCGHDWHTAALICCAEYLSQNREKLSNNIVFIFQPGEETTTGAKTLIDNGLFEKLPAKPDMLFGLHNRPEMPNGTVRVQSGALMAAKSDFTITVKGKTGHSGSPHQCVDPIVAAAAIINAVQTIVSRNTDPFEPCVCAVCSVHGGTPANFAPESVTLTGSIRSLNNAVHSMCEKRLTETAESICKGYNCKCDIDIKRLLPVLYNTPEMTGKARDIAQKAVEEERIITAPPCMGSEDFSVLGEYAPYYFFWIGSSNGKGEQAPWHSEKFTVGDKFLKTAAAIYTSCAFCEIKK